MGGAFAKNCFTDEEKPTMMEPPCLDRWPAQQFKEVAVISLKGGHGNEANAFVFCAVKVEMKLMKACSTKVWLSQNFGCTKISMIYLEKTLITRCEFETGSSSEVLLNAFTCWTRSER